MSKNTSPIGGYYPTSSNTSQTQSGTSSGTSTTQPNPLAGQLYTQALYNAANVASQPFEPYQGQMVAGFTPSQMAAQQGFQNAVGMSSPYYDTAASLYNQGLQYQNNPMIPLATNYYGQGISSANNPLLGPAQNMYQQSVNYADPNAFTQNTLSRYMNPYQQSVVDATMRQLEQTQNKMLGENTQRSVMRGSYGGSGQFLGQAEIARQQALSNAQTLAGLNAQNYAQAADMYGRQQAQAIQAYQNAAQGVGGLGYQNAALQSQALQNAAQGLGSLGASQQAQQIANIQNLAAGMGGLGTQAQTAYLQGLAALQQSGATQQQLQQAQLSNAYQQWLQAKAYPYQQLSYFTGLAQGVAPYLGQLASQNSDFYSTGTGSQLSMQPYANQSGGGGLAGGLTSLIGLGAKAFGFKDGGSVKGREEYAKGGAAEDTEEDTAPGFGSLITKTPYTSAVNYPIESLKLARAVKPAKEISAEQLGQAIASTISGIPRVGGVGNTSKEITSSFFGQPQSSGSSGLGDLASSLSERKKSSDDEGTTEDNDKGGLGALSSLFSGGSEGEGGGLSALAKGDFSNIFADGGRVGREGGGQTTTSSVPKTISELVKRPESIEFNRQLNPSGNSGLGFKDLMKQVYEDSAGPQLTPEQQGRKAMPDSLYYRKKLPLYGFANPTRGMSGYPTSMVQALADTQKAGGARTGESITTPTGETVTPAQKDAMNAQYLDQYAFINNMYQQYVGRSPTVAEAQKWVSSMGGGYGAPGSGTSQQEFGALPMGLTPMQVENWFANNSTERINALKPVVQGYYSRIASPKINAATGLYNLDYTGEYYSPGYTSQIEDIATTSDPYFSPYAPGVPESAHAEGAIIPNIPGKTDMWGNPIKPKAYKGGRIGRKKGGRLERAIGGNTGNSHYDAVYDAVFQAAKRRGAPHPEVLARVGAAQSSLETGGGRHAPNNNYFGIKGPGGSFATTEVVNGRPVSTRASFRGYPTMQHSADDFVRLMSSSPRYRGVFTADTPEKAISAQARSGYATDPNYGSKLALLDARHGGGTGRILPPEPLNLSVGASASPSSVAFKDYTAPSSGGEAPSAPAAKEQKSGGFGSLLADALGAGIGAAQAAEQPKLAEAPEMEMAPLPVAKPMMFSPEMKTPEQERYLDSLLEAERSYGGRLHFSNGGTDMDEDSRNRFYREQLEGSAPQYDPEAGWNTADRMGEIGLNLAALIPAGKAIKPLQTAYKIGKGALNAFRNMNKLAGSEGVSEPGLGALEYQPQAPRGRQPSPSGEPIPMGVSVPRKGMNRFEANTEGMRRGVPGNDIYQWSTLRDPQGNRPMNAFEQNQTGLAWNRFGAYEPNKAPAYYDKFGNVAPPKVSYDGVAQRPIPEFQANQGFFTQGLPGSTTRAGSAGRVPPGGRGFFSGKPEFTPAELGQELATQGGSGIVPQGRTNLPALTMNAPPIPPMPGDLPPFNPNITSEMATPKLTDYYHLDQVAKDRPTAASKRAPARKAAPEDNRRYWGDWRDTAGFNEDPIGNFLDELTGDVRAARRPGNINSPMSPYAGNRFANGGRAYRGEGGFLDSLGDTLSTGLSNLRSNKDSPISEGLITAGLGMMSSPQHDPLRAIGEGGLIGIQAYNTARARQKARQDKLDEDQQNRDFAKTTMDQLNLLSPRPMQTPQPITPMRRGGPARPTYANGGQPQSNQPLSNDFDPFEALSSIGDTIGSGLSSLGETVGNALMPKAEAAVAQDREPSATPTRRSQASPISDALITAGLGMMASPAHDPLRAIGEGGLRGVQAYNTSMEEQRKEDEKAAEKEANAEFVKTLTPGAAPPAPTTQKVAEKDTETEQPEKKPVVATDQPVVEDPIDAARRQLEYLSTVIPKNATQEKILTRLINQKKYELSGNVGILGTDQFGIPRRGYISGPRAGTYLDDTSGRGTAVPKNVHGDEFLEMLPDQDMANTVKSIAEGKSKIPTGPRGARVRAAVLQYDPDYREARYDVIQSMGKTSGNNIGATINVGNTAIKHLGEASDAIKDLKKTEFSGGQFPLVNWLQQKIKPGLGGYEELKRLEDAKERFAEEATKFYRGVGGAEADVKRTMDRLNAAQTPSELNAILDEEISLFAGKVKGLQSVYNTAFKSKNVKYEDWNPLSEESENYIKMVHGRSPKKFTHTMDQEQPKSESFVEGSVYPRGGKNYLYKNGQFFEVAK